MSYFDQICDGSELKIRFKSGLEKILLINSTSPTIFWATDQYGEQRVYHIDDVESVFSVTEVIA